MPRGISRYDEAKLQGRLWTPQVLGKAIVGAWYDIGDVSTVTIGGSNLVSQVLDKSGNGLTIAQATGGKQPTYSRTALNFSPGTTGARPGLIFSAGQTLWSSSALQSSNAFSGFAVFQFNGTANYPRILTLDSAAGGGEYYSLLLGISSSTTGIATYDGGVLSNPTFKNTTLGQPHVGCSINDGSTNTVYADGYAGSTVAHVKTASTPFPDMGADSNAIDGMLNGAVSEGIYTIGPTQLFREKIEGYLAWKWGLVDQLTPAHPYKNRPPSIGG